MSEYDEAKENFIKHEAYGKYGSEFIQAADKEIATRDAELARLREALNEAKRRLRRGIVIPKDIADSIDEALKSNDSEDSE